MSKLIAALLAGVFAVATVTPAFAADKKEEPKKTEKKADEKKAEKK